MGVKKLKPNILKRRAAYMLRRPPVPVLDIRNKLLQITILQPFNRPKRADKPEDLKVVEFYLEKTDVPCKVVVNALSKGLTVLSV